VEFLVHIGVTWPADGDAAERERRIQAERARARELADAGIIKRLWRVPGRWANWGLWEAEDATAIHEAVVSLPMWPYIDVEVIPLAEHPSDPRRSSTERP